MSPEETSGKIEVFTSEQFTSVMAKLREEHCHVPMLERGKGRALWVIYWTREVRELKQPDLGLG